MRDMDSITTIYEGARSEVCQGIELKMNIHIAPIDGYTMDAYEFTCIAYCSSTKKIVATKSECIRVDSENYMMLVDTGKLTTGDLHILVIAQVPDSDMPDMLRAEPTDIDTGITIIRSAIDLTSYLNGLH